MPEDDLVAEVAAKVQQGRQRRLCGLLAAAWIGLGSHALVAQTQTPCVSEAAAVLTVSFSASCTALTCTFTVTPPVPSTAVDFEWDFGDGTFVDGAATSVTHTYGGAGYYSVTLTVTWSNQQVTTTTVGICLGGSPLAADDAFTTPSDTPLAIAIAELLSNDAPGMTFVQIDQPSKCPLNGDGLSCTYTPATTPAPGTVSLDWFTYTVQDAAGHQGRATVTITVTRPLVAGDDFYTYVADANRSYMTIYAADLLRNDTPGAVFVRAQNWEGGTVQQVQASPAVLQFTPASGIYGMASFDYLVSWDGVNPPFARGHVYIDVEPAKPTATFTVSCANRTCTVHTMAQPAPGLTLQKYFWDWGDGTPVIQPPSPSWADQTHTYARSGRYTITHTVTDSFGQSGSAQAAVLANTPPVAANDSATTERNLTVTIPVLANDVDPDGDPLSIASADVLSSYPGAQWQVVPSGTSWALKITPPNNFIGTMTFHYTAGDPWGGASTATVTLTVTQWKFIVAAVGEQFFVGQNLSLRIPKATLLANDYQQNNEPLTIVNLDTSLLMGRLDCTSDPSACTYTPPTNAAGTTLFRYTISDPEGRQDSATVRIYVGVYGQPPTAHDGWLTTVLNTPRSFTIQDIVQAAYDPDGDSLQVIGFPTGATDYGAFSCSTPFYLCTYTPNTGYVGTDRSPYTVTDMINAPASAGLNMVTLPPSTPTFDAREDVIVTAQNQQTYFSYGYLTGNDYAPSGGPVTVSSIDTTGLQGTLSCDSGGCLYQPPFYFTGPTRFRYTASDGHGATDTAIVKVNVGIPNNPPVANPAALSTPRNTPLRFSVFELLRSGYDPDNDPLTVTLYTFGGSLGTLSCPGSPQYWCTYTPNANVTGTDVFTYALSDGQASVTSTLTFTITP